MLTNDKSSHLHGVITILIMKFFETHFETFSCNLLINKEERQIIKILGSIKEKKLRIETSS